MIKTISFISVLLTSVISLSASDLHFVSIENLAEQEVGRLIIKKLYSDLGKTITISPVPGKRARAEVIAQRKDGEIMRIREYGEKIDQVIRVATPYYKLETMAFKKKDNPIVIKSKKDLEKLRIVVVRGVRHTKLITENLSNVYRVKSTAQMMKFLNAGRADIALTNTLDGELYIKKNRITTIVKAGQPLAVYELYHYLLKKHKSIAIKLNLHLIKLKKNGKLKEIVKQSETQVLGKQASLY